MNRRSLERKKQKSFVLLIVRNGRKVIILTPYLATIASTTSKDFWRTDHLFLTEIIFPVICRSSLLPHFFKSAVSRVSFTFRCNLCQEDFFQTKTNELFVTFLTFLRGFWAANYTTRWNFWQAKKNPFLTCSLLRFKMAKNFELET